MEHAISDTSVPRSMLEIFSLCLNDLICLPFVECTHNIKKITTGILPDTDKSETFSKWILLSQR